MSQEVPWVPKRCLCPGVSHRGIHDNRCHFAPVGPPCPTIVPACLLLLSFVFTQVFMIDATTKQASRIGVCVLPVFVKYATLDRADDSDSKVICRTPYPIKLLDCLSVSVAFD